MVAYSRRCKAVACDGHGKGVRDLREVGRHGFVAVHGHGGGRRIGIGDIAGPVAKLPARIGNCTDVNHGAGSIDMVAYSRRCRAVACHGHGKSVHDRTAAKPVRVVAAISGVGRINGGGV